ncbi:MAG: hypothetical protein FWG56_00745, partial [Desulfovibrionaceae bacterium]|nr:hypothetical protein [Desulfovibrionaceae bacterium]
PSRWQAGVLYHDVIGLRPPPPGQLRTCELAIHCRVMHGKKILDQWVLPEKISLHLRASPPRDTQAALAGISAASAICVLLTDSAATVIHEKDADRVMAPASITKLLTALVAVGIAEKTGRADTMILEMTREDEAAGSGHNLLAGDRLSFSDSLANLLLPSSNMTANMMARTFGQLLLELEPNAWRTPMERFVAEMNATAQRLNMSSSHFLNPSGLAAPGQRSTARDLSLLVMQCLACQPITSIWGHEASCLNISGPNARRLTVESAFHSPTARAVPAFAAPRYRGGKTGSLSPSVFNLAAVSSAEGGQLLISVTLGSPTIADRYFDYLKLLQTCDGRSAAPVTSSSTPEDSPA